VNRLVFEILHVLFKRQIIIVGAFAVIFGAVALGLFFRSDVYRAPGRVMITGQRAYFRLAPGESRQPPSDPDIRDINTEIETIKSAAFLNKVLVSLPFSLLNGANGGDKDHHGEEDQGLIAGTARAIHGGITTITELPTTVSKAISSIFAPNADSPESEPTDLASRPNPALAVLRAGLDVIAVPNSSLIEVAFSDKDPKRAAVVVNAILEAYPLHQASLYQDPIALAFYDKQRDHLEQEIADLEAKLRDFESRENLVALNEQKQQSLALLEKVKDRLKGADLDIEQGHGKIAELERQIPQQPATVVQTQDIMDAQTKLLQERLTTLEIEKNELLQKYTEKDRRVQDKAAEMAVLREKLASAPKNKILVGERIGLNAVRQDMLRELAEQKVKLGQIYPKRETLARHVEEINKELVVMNTKGYELQHMQEILANKKEAFALYRKKAEEARISGAMDRENLVNVKVTDRAQIPMLPVASNAALLLTLAAIVGLGAGIGGVLTLEYARPTFHSEIDVERHLRLPVLALIPDLREEA
jgi:uncharacterized protein involved in exopolysaccharide biosynthesis